MILYNVSTVEEQWKDLSNLEVTRAKGIRELQNLLLCPSNEDMSHAVDYNILANNWYRRINLRNATKIFDKSKEFIKEKSVKKKSRLPREDIAIKRPTEIERKFQSVTLSVNVMHLNQIPFMVAKPYHINYYQVQPLNDLKGPTKFKASTEMCSEYSSRRGKVTRS